MSVAVLLIISALLPLVSFAILAFVGKRMGNPLAGMVGTFFVAGSYWMSCIKSFWKTTLPGVVAMFTPSSKALLSVIEIRS